MGLLDFLKDAYTRGAGLLAPNQADVNYRPEITKGLLSFLPGTGDAISGYDAVQSAREGDYLGAALGGLGALPFVPNMAGWTVHKLSGGTKVIENPTRQQAFNLAKQSKMQELRAIRDKETGKLYVWDAYDAIHQPVADELGLDFAKIRDQTSRYAENYGIMNIPAKSIEGYPLKMFSGD